MHGVVALKFGDHTAERAGRLTLNPLSHIDPIGSILVPALLILPRILGFGGGFFIAWAKPVPVNPLNFSNIKQGELMVSAAGILSNFALAIISTILYLVLSPTVGPDNLFLQLMSFTTTINLVLGTFNLVPIPPLDGSKIVLSQLPYNLAKEYERLENIGPIILLLLLWATPILGILLGAVLSVYSQTLSMPLRSF